MVFLTVTRRDRNRGTDRRSGWSGRLVGMTGWSVKPNGAMESAGWEFLFGEEPGLDPVGVCCFVRPHFDSLFATRKYSAKGFVRIRSSAHANSKDS